MPRSSKPKPAIVPPYIGPRAAAWQFDAVGDGAGALRRPRSRHGKVSETCTHGSRKGKQIAGLRPIALERIAAATDPLALEQVDLAFPGVDAVSDTGSGRRWRGADFEGESQGAAEDNSDQRAQCPASANEPKKTFGLRIFPVMTPNVSV